jgi:hypothetical protein
VERRKPGADAKTRFSQRIRGARKNSRRRVMFENEVFKRDEVLPDKRNDLQRAVDYFCATEPEGYT